MNYSEPIKTKNPSACSLPDIVLSLEIGGTVYRFKGVYDGQRALPAKLIRLMDNEKFFDEGADK